MGGGGGGGNGLPALVLDGLVDTGGLTVFLGYLERFGGIIFYFLLVV